MPDQPPNVVAAFAAFVRQRLSEVGSTVRGTVTAPLAPLLRRDSGAEFAAHRETPDGRRNLAMVIVAAAAPFAPTAQARARLLRQAHASGLLSASETEDALKLSAERRAIGAPRV